MLSATRPGTKRIPADLGLLVLPFTGINGVDWCVGGQFGMRPASKRASWSFGAGMVCAKKPVAKGTWLAQPVNLKTE